MKRILLILLIFSALLCVLNGCRQKKNVEAENADTKINVITSIFAPYDFVRQIAGDRVNLSMLLPPGSESHSFEPSPADIIRIQNSDIFIFTGGESDEWVERILQSTDTGQIKMLALLDTVEAVEEEIVEGMEPEEEEEHGHSEHGEEIAFDEHVWTSPRNAILIVRAITELLCGADSGNAAFFRQNAAACISSLEEIDAAFSEIVTGAKRNTIVFGDRFPFRYFVDAYGLDYFAAFPGCSTETEPSAATVAFLIDKIKSEQIPVVFYIELSNERMADTISGETGAKKLLLHACHNITKRDFDSGISYLDIMRQNAENLKEALN